jgi:hypothetical protein
MELADYKIERLPELLMNQSVYEALLAGQDPRRIAEDWQEGLQKFVKMREKYLIYKQGDLGSRSGEVRVKRRGHSCPLADQSPN